MNATMPVTDPSSLPLHGLRVVEFGQFIAVPAAGQTLRDLGADVIKIEPPGGDVARISGWTQDAYGPMFTAFNRAKRSVVLDLRTPANQASALALAASADVVLQNMRPGVMARQGLGSAALMALAPRLIYGQVSGFGQSGPASARPGLDIAAQAESGMMSLNGAGDGEPTRVGFTAVDVMAAHALSTGVLAALVRRSITGRGGLVEVSLIDVAVEALGNAWAEYHLTGVLPRRCGNGQPNAAPAADVFPTHDGMVVVSAYTADHFARLCNALDLPALIDHPLFRDNHGRVANRPALRAALGQAIGVMTTENLCALLTRAGVVVGTVRTMAEVVAGQDGVSGDLFVEVLAEGRDPVRVPGSPMTLDGMARTGGRLPALGEHTNEVMAELAELTAARRQGAARSAT